eukprot:3383921-Amphidinium_carterae.1
MVPTLQGTFGPVSTTSRTARVISQLKRPNKSCIAACVVPSRMDLNEVSSRSLRKAERGVRVLHLRHPKMRACMDKYNPPNHASTQSDGCKATWRDKATCRLKLVGQEVSTRLNKCRNLLIHLIISHANILRVQNTLADMTSAIVSR